LVRLLLAFLSLSPLGRWELIEYLGEAVVIVGVLTEYLAEFHVLQKEEQKVQRRKLAKLGSLILLAGLAVELSGVVRTSQLSGALIAALNTDIGSAQASADAAATDASLARQSAQDANKALAKAQAQLQQIEQGETVLRNKNLELAQNLATLEKGTFPRNLRQKEFAEKIKSTKGPSVFIETISDFEARRTASIIASGIDMAKPNWRVNSLTIRTDEKALVDFFFPGVLVSFNCWDLRVTVPDVKRAKECTDAVGLFINALNSNGITIGWPEKHIPPVANPDSNLPSDTILVRVGMKPVPGEPLGNLVVVQ
jgi:hypothetical protein